MTVLFLRNLLVSAKIIKRAQIGVNEFCKLPTRYYPKSLSTRHISFAIGRHLQGVKIWEHSFKQRAEAGCKR
jgi:hypothetical protein